VKNGSLPTGWVRGAAGGIRKETRERENWQVREWPGARETSERNKGERGTRRVGLRLRVERERKAAWQEVGNVVTNECSSLAIAGLVGLEGNSSKGKN
jgi:hypothetical protein